MSVIASKKSAEIEAHLPLFRHDLNQSPTHEYFVNGLRPKRSGVIPDRS